MEKHFIHRLCDRDLRIGPRSQTAAMVNPVNPKHRTTVLTGLRRVRDKVRK